MVHAERMVKAYKQRIQILGDQLKQAEARLLLQEEAYKQICKELASVKLALAEQSQPVSVETIRLETQVALTEANASSEIEPAPKTKSRRRRTTPEAIPELPMDTVVEPME